MKHDEVAALAVLLAAAMFCGCSKGPAPATYLDPDCGVLFSSGCSGTLGPDGSATCAPFSCRSVPADCTGDLTCECIGCAACSCGGGGGVTCEYDAGTFHVECVNP